MKKQPQPSSHNNFLKNRFLRTIFLVSVILTITLPLSYVVFTHPAFTKLLLDDKRDDATSIARHLSSLIPTEHTDLKQTSLPVDLLNDIVEHKNDFGLRKIRVFSKEGEIIFSTDVDDIGLINQEKYFYDVISKGRIYTEVVQRHTESLEGQRMSADVVETYVPLMRDDKFLGAFEIYYDITVRKDQLHHLLSHSLATLTILAGGLLSIIMFFLFKENRTIAERMSAEEALRESEEHYRSLFTNNHAVMLLIDPETADIVDANPEACSFYGYTREELTAKKITDINTLTDEEVFQEMKEAKSEDRQHFFFSHRLVDGEIRDVEVYSGPIALRGKHLLYSIIHDISARKRAEEQVQRTHDELEQRVEERTADLIKANERLRQEIEERKRIGEALRSSEKKYRALINEASDSIVLSDTEGNVLDTNRKALELFGYSKDELFQKHVTELHPKEELEETLTAFKKAVQSGSGSLNDTKILRKDGKTVPVDISGSVIQYGDQKVVQGFFRDITERKRAEEVVRNIAEGVSASTGEIFFQSLVRQLAQMLEMDFVLVGELIDQIEENVETVAVWAHNDIVDNFTYELANTPCQNVVGQALCCYPENVQEQFPLDQMLQEMNVECYVGVPLFDSRGSPLGIMAVLDGESLENPEFVESTLRVFAARASAELQRKRAEDALRKSEKELRFLSSELLNAQESERARIARELHDGVGQALSTMKVRLETLAKIARSDVSQITAENLENLVPMIRQTIEEVRNTSMDLRPSTLDSLGILPTIDWFSREFQTTYPVISIQKQIDIQESEVPDFLKIVIYRILQEALNNAASHSRADLVRISLAKTDGEMMLALQDNGRGFDLEHTLALEDSRRGFGLTSMKERTELSGGSFSIESSVGQGTTVRATWPI